MSEKWSVFLFEYGYDGARWSFQMQARNEAEAMQRLWAMQYAQLLGTLEATIPVEVGGWLPRLICWWKNRKAVSR